MKEIDTGNYYDGFKDEFDDKKIRINIKAYPVHQYPLQHEYLLLSF